MSVPVRMKKLAMGAASILMDFAHGGLLTMGVAVSVFAAAAYTGAVPRDWLQPFQPQVPTVSAASEAIPGEPTTARVAVRPASQGIIDYLARKYRVAAGGIEPVVHAANAAGLRLGLDPLLIVAVIAVESRFNPIAESPMGAQGLMQVVPRFHQDKLGPDGKMLLDPVQNVDLGARVLKESIRRAGSIEAGLQQYAGAPTDAEAQYASKVIAEKQRLEQAQRRTVTGRTGAPREA